MTWVFVYKCTKCTQASSCQAANGNKRLMLSQALNHAYKRICILLMWGRQKQHTSASLRKQELNLASKATARYSENKLQDNKKAISPQCPHAKACCYYFNTFFCFSIFACLWVTATVIQPMNLKSTCTILERIPLKMCLKTEKWFHSPDASWLSSLTCSRNVSVESSPVRQTCQRHPFTGNLFSSSILPVICWDCNGIRYNSQQATMVTASPLCHNCYKTAHLLLAFNHIYPSLFPF